MKNLNNWEKSLLLISLLVFLMTLSFSSYYNKELLLIFFGVDIILILVLFFGNLSRNDKDNLVFYVAMFVGIGSPIATYIIVLTIKLVKSILIPVGNATTWIGFAGSIIGGAMTLFAVIFTIRFEDSKRSDQLRIDEARDLEKKASLYLPILELSSTGHTFFDSLEIQIESVTESPVRDLYLVSSECGINPELKNIFKMEPRPFVSAKREIVGDYSQRIKLDTLKLTLEKNLIPAGIQSQLFPARLVFKYSDAIGIKEYKHKVEFEMRISLSKNKQQYTIHTAGRYKNYPLVESKLIEKTKEETK